LSQHRPVGTRHRIVFFDTASTCDSAPSSRPATLQFDPDQPGIFIAANNVINARRTPRWMMGAVDG
jgi:hypothetical protein